MNHFLIQQGTGTHLLPFPFIAEFAIQKNIKVRPNTFPESQSEHICIYYIEDGKFEWIINNQKYVLYPGDVAFILPGQTIGAVSGSLDIGHIHWLFVKPDVFFKNGKRISENWCGFSCVENSTIKEIFKGNKMPVIHNCRNAKEILQNLQSEIFGREIGYITRTKQLVADLIITIARLLGMQNSSVRDFPELFMKLDLALRQNLSHQWKVKEMASLAGMGISAFTEKIKAFTGFSPIGYLIHIRITEAIERLKSNEGNLTGIALETGFYSSQHFSTTFKKLTGYSPSRFRKLKNTRSF